MKYVAKIMIVLGLSVMLSACGDNSLQYGGDDNGKDGALQPESIQTCYLDEDQDGYGDPNNMVESDNPPLNCIEDNQDCDDQNDTVYPGAVEICGDNIDQDCDGSDLACPPTDADNDGSPVGTDCNDNDATIYPGAVEICGDGIDQDCNGSDLVCPPVDNDSDGYSPPEDCNDNDAAIHPGAAEVCNGIDDNCDGNIDEGVSLTFYQDADSDTYGNAAASTQACTAPTGYVADATDCNDSADTIHPGAIEICGDTIDQDCDGSDLVCPPVDNDSDGYSPPEDCNDNNAAINPGATEVCNGIDDNCDTQIDEGLPLNTYYADTDSDTFGNAANTTETCSNSAPAGYVADNTDCNDTDAAINPNATEVCNGIDDNCDTQIDEGLALNTYYADTDGDTYGDIANATETCSNTAPAGYVTNSTDCDDSDATIHPGASETCDDGIDQDCNGSDLVCPPDDNDSDGYAPPEDCNDNDPAIHPNATEVCNGIDDNCDGAIDEGVLLTFYEDSDVDTYGNAAVSTTACTAPSGYVADNTDCDDTNAAINPGATEICNDIDDDCNAQIDDGLPLNTYYADTDTDTYGDPTNTTETCSASPPAGYVTDNTDCNDNNIAINPGATEICDNSIDDNCDGLTDSQDTVTCALPGPPLPPINVSATDCDPDNYDEAHFNITVTWGPDPAGPAPDHYRVYRTTYAEDNPYELVSPDLTETSFEFVQTWDDVLNIIGPTPGLSPTADFGDTVPPYPERETFITALNDYRDFALPYLIDFKAPAFFKVEACNAADECSELSAADAGSAEYIHTEAYSEVALHLIPSWGYAQLIALADAPPGANGLIWCGIDLCGSGGGIARGRVSSDSSGYINVDVQYEDFTETDVARPGSYFLANGILGGNMLPAQASNGELILSGNFTLNMPGRPEIDLAMFAHIGIVNPDSSRSTEGIATITYKGIPYQFTLPIAPADGVTSGSPAVSIDPVVPIQTTEPAIWYPSSTVYPLGSVNTNPPTRCQRSWSTYTVPTCPASIVP